jgi:CBS domain-containing protein
MDGGRVARAIAWRTTGDRNAATRFAADLGRILGWGIIAAGVYMTVTNSIFGSFGGLWLAVIGVMINGAAKSAAQQTRVGGRIHHISVADVMDRQPVTIPGDISVEQALDQYFLRYRWPWFPVVDAAHRFLGLLQREAADDVPEVSRTVSLVSDIVDHDRGLFIRDDAPLDSLLSNANLRRFGALMAVDADGRLSGVVTVEQVGRALKESTSFTGP